MWRALTVCASLRLHAVNTKADIRFDVLGCDFLPDWIKENLMQQARARGHVRLLAQPACLTRAPSRLQEKNRMNNEGELVVNSSRHRTQKCALTCSVVLPHVHAPARLLTAALSHHRQNYEDALEKLQAMIDAAAKPPQGPSDETIKKVKTLCVPLRMCALQRHAPCS